MNEELSNSCQQSEIIKNTALGIKPTEKLSLQCLLHVNEPNQHLFRRPVITDNQHLN